MSAKAYAVGMFCCLLTLSLGTSPPTLFFSQYQEQEQDATTDRSAGPANYLQIYNPLSVAVDLAKDFSIATCLNGCSREDTFEYGLRFKFGATIAAQGTYTLCNAGLKERTG